MSRIIIFILILTSILSGQNPKSAVKGKITDAVSGKPIAGCTVSLPNQKSGAISDTSGQFALLLPKGVYTLVFTHVSYERRTEILKIEPDRETRRLEVSLKPAVLMQNEVNITVKRNSSVSVQEIRAVDITRVPTVFNDVLRGVTILSGVVSNNELSSGYNVRGGNFSENLIYLNGYEIYRPFLLRQGTEENQTLMNPDMVDKVEFHNGSFSAEYGDKMSSALAVLYKKEQDDRWHGKLRANLLNGSVVAGRSFGQLHLLIGGRYAYPYMLANSLNTSGTYHPFFADFQMLANYNFLNGDNMELFIVQAKNRFNLTPANWSGRFMAQPRVPIVSAADVTYKGKREYEYNTGLYALRFRKLFSSVSSGYFSVMRGATDETEKADLRGDYIYIPDVDSPDDNTEYLKTRFEYADDDLKIRTTEINAAWLLQLGQHNLTSGILGRWRRVEDRVNEVSHDTGAVTVFETPVDIKSSRVIHPNEYSLFFIDTYKPSVMFDITAGIRATYAAISNEYLISPRIQATWRLTEKNTLFAGWGFYYQPPYYLESRNNNVPLSSQRAIHYSLGWENRFKQTMRLRTEFYYKRLDHLIPYYTEGQKIIYSGANSREGYAYGMDLLVQGEIVEGMQSWVGYGLLVTKDRPESGGAWVRRLTDQTHSLLIFLQDRIKKHTNWQVHTRLLAGSGTLFFDRDIAYDPVSQKYYTKVAFNRPQELFLYLRADMGCSVALNLMENKKVTLTAEVLNIFDHRNYASYSFVQALKDTPRPIRVPEVLSPRLFNFQIELEM